jgi:hypothetical protein
MYLNANKIVVVKESRKIIKRIENKDDLPKDFKSLTQH